MGAAVFELLKTVIMLGLVLGLIVVMSRVARRLQSRGISVTQRAASRTTEQVDVVARRSLGKHMALIVVRVADRTLLVGQTPQSVTLVADLSGEDVAEAPLPGVADVVGTAPGTVRGSEVHTAGAWDAFVDRLREMTVRR